MKADPAERAAWARKAVLCLERGIDRGINPASLATDPALKPLRDGPEASGRLESLGHRPAAYQPIPDVPPFLHPCPDLTD
jgi:hypothetical protein